MGSVSELNLTPEGQEFLVVTNARLLPACLLLRTQILCISIGVSISLGFNNRKLLVFRLMNVNEPVMFYI